MMFGNGNYSTLASLIETFTEQNEESGKLLVYQETHENFILREFATKEKGLVETLIVCNAVATFIQKTSNEIK